MLHRASGPLLLILFNFLAATTLAFPTWYLAVFQYKCTAPSIVEVKAEDWNEWKISSICHPGTCCSSQAPTGPLCTVAACEQADLERERLLKSKIAIDAAARKANEQQAQNKSPEMKLAEEQKAEAEWKKKEDAADAEKAKALAAQAQQLV